MIPTVALTAIHKTVTDKLVRMRRKNAAISGSTGIIDS